MMPAREEVVAKLKQIIAGRLLRGVSAADIGDDQPLFDPTDAATLGLDSVEALEIVLGIEEVFGIRIEETDGIEERFHSVNTLADFVMALAAAQDSGSLS